MHTTVFPSMAYNQHKLAKLVIDLPSITPVSPGGSPVTDGSCYGLLAVTWSFE